MIEVSEIDKMPTPTSENDQILQFIKSEIANRNKKKKPKMESSKKWLIACIVISVMFTSLSYILAMFDKNPVENLSIETIRMLWAVDGVSFIGYNMQNCFRAFAYKNKSE